MMGLPEAYEAKVLFSIKKRHRSDENTHYKATCSRLQCLHIESELSLPRERDKRPAAKHGREREKVRRFCSHDAKRAHPSGSVQYISLSRAHRHKLRSEARG